MKGFDVRRLTTLLSRAALLAGFGLALSLGASQAALAACGNGVIEPGEDCDDGSQNGTSNSCCSSSCTATSKAPDVIVGDLVGRSGPYRLNGIHAFGIGTTSCNIGTCWLNWFQNNAEHPAIGQNMYRLKNGRFEQIGQAWLKHGFTALQGTVCSMSCQPSATGGTHLGVNCSDPYSSSLNDDQERMGPKFEVDPSSGAYAYPISSGKCSVSTSTLCRCANNSNPSCTSSDCPAGESCLKTGDVIYKRLQVHDADLDPGQNAGALYYVEGQYVTHDDALAKNNANNGSYRTITVSGTAGSGLYDITLTNSTQRQKFAIEAWKVADPTVVQTVTSGFILSSKATSLGGGMYRYEYALMNTTNERAAGSFAVGLPPAATVANTGFHDVDYHSGEPFNGTDWPASVGPTTVSWATTPYATNPNANALRWGTLYNYRFDTNSPPVSGNVTVGYFRPGGGDSFPVTALVPDACNHDGVCGTGETCANCAADCSNQGGGTGCCGNGTCEAGESPCRCAADCGSPTAIEGSCVNGIDEDCDNQTDCADVDCCTNGACAATDTDHDGFNALCDCANNDGTVYPGAPQLCDAKNNNCSDPGWPALPPEEADGDSDGVPVCANDCNDGNGTVWAVPSETTNLQIEKVGGGLELTWTPPIPPGGSVTHFDILRSNDPDNFTTGAVCVATDISGTLFNAPVGPNVPGAVTSYLLRARNACPNGVGVLGYDSNGQPIAGRSCP
jgi:hypothetical protein